MGTPDEREALLTGLSPFAVASGTSKLQFSVLSIWKEELSFLYWQRRLCFLGGPAPVLGGEEEEVEPHGSAQEPVTSQ